MCEWCGKCWAETRQKPFDPQQQVKEDAERDHCGIALNGQSELLFFVEASESLSVCVCLVSTQGFQFVIQSWTFVCYGYHRSNDNKRKEKKERERMEGFVCEIAPLLPFGFSFLLCKSQLSVDINRRSCPCFLSLVLCNKLLGCS